MTISYPLNFPTAQAMRNITFRAASIIGVQPSPLTLEHTVYAWPGDGWEADVECPPMTAADAEPWVAGFLLALNGMEGTFLMGPADAGQTAQRGTWAGASPLVVGAHAAGVRTVAVDGLSAGATGKAGDWLQFGSGSASRLHKLVEDFTANGSGEGTAEIWPRTRVALADNAPVTLASPKAVWRLASNVRRWSIDLGQWYAPLRFSCIEARDG